MKLLREQSGRKVADDAALDLRRIDLRVLDCGTSGLDNHVAQALALFGEVSLEIGPADADGCLVKRGAFVLCRGQITTL